MTLLQDKCPTLFDAYLSRVDKRDMEAADLLSDDCELDVNLPIRDDAHRRLTVIGRVPNTTKPRHLINDNRILPQKDSLAATGTQMS